MKKVYEEPKAEWILLTSEEEITDSVLDGDMSYNPDFDFDE